MMNSMLSLLVVDDEPIILKGLVTTYDWNSYGFRIAGTANDGMEALKRVDELKPDVLLIDIVMKKMNGLECIRRCALKHPHMKYVIISAYSEFEYARQACDLGVYSYLLKPIDEKRLESIMIDLHRKCIEEKQKKWHSNSIQMVMQEEGGEGQKEGKLNDCLLFINQNISNENLNLTFVADKFHYNPAYFGRLFKEIMDVSFGEYIANLRIEKAKKLLMLSDMSVLEVALTVGIPNHSYFSMLFKMKIGITPSDFRKKFNNVQ